MLFVCGDAVTEELLLRYVSIHTQAIASIGSPDKLQALILVDWEPRILNIRQCNPLVTNNAVYDCLISTTQHDQRLIGLRYTYPNNYRSDEQYNIQGLARDTSGAVEFCSFTSIFIGREYMDRRTFLQSSAAAAGTMAIASGVSNKADAAVNPAITDNLVVNCKDSRMVTGAYSDNYTTQFSRLDNAQIKTNLDAMAMALASRTTAAAAWATIFQKPSSKEWSATTVSIKVNCINSYMYVKPAIIGKVCDELLALGVRAQNICLFDGGNATDEATRYNNYIGNGKPIPVGVVALNKSASQNIKNTKDIMVNCAINKGHGNGNAGNVTLCMKNHTGTYKFSCPSSKDEVVNWSKDAITNGRQQLCIIDSLFGACTGPNDRSSAQPNCISMSTHPAAIDVLVTRNIRKSTMMSCNEETATFDYFLSQFGMARANLQWMDVTPAAVTSVRNGSAEAVFNDKLDLQVRSDGQIIAEVKYPGRHSCMVTRMDGSVVASQKGSGFMAYRFADRLTPGSYVVSVIGENGFKAERVANISK